MNFGDLVRRKIPWEVFTEQDLKLALPEYTSAAILSGLSRTLHSQDLIKLKRGVYSFGSRLQKRGFSKFVAAQKIYFPSYVSFESALLHHGLIPEGVYVTTSACEARKKKVFSTFVGDFSYQHIPCKPFFGGVEQVEKDATRFLMANPLKAFFDLIYVRKKEIRSMKQLESDIRLNVESFGQFVSTLSMREIEDLAFNYRKRKIQRTAQFLLRSFK